MKIDFAFICDYADTSGGKINALGIGFDTIYASTIPIHHPLFFLVFQIRANVVEAGEKSMVVNLIDDDGQNIIPPLNGKINIAKPAAGTESVGRVAMAFNGVRFPKYGSYSLHAVVEGHDMVNVSMKVSQPPKSV